MLQFVSISVKSMNRSRDAVVTIDQRFVCMLNSYEFTLKLTKKMFFNFFLLLLMHFNQINCGFVHTKCSVGFTWKRFTSHLKGREVLCLLNPGWELVPHERSLTAEGFACHSFENSKVKKHRLCCIRRSLKWPFLFLRVSTFRLCCLS